MPCSRGTLEVSSTEAAVAGEAWDPPPADLQGPPAAVDGQGQQRLQGQPAAVHGQNQTYVVEAKAAC